MAEVEQKSDVPNNQPSVILVDHDVRTNLVPERGPVKVLQQKTELRDLIGKSVRRFNARVIYDNAFPSSTCSIMWAKDAVIEALKIFHPEDFARAMERRIHADNAYFNRMVTMVRFLTTYTYEDITDLIHWKDFITRQQLTI